MLFTPEGLEQATHEAVAAYHARRFPKGARVADLTCGIGADLIAVAGRGPVVGFEVDSEAAACALHNAWVHGLEVDVRIEDCLTAAWEFEFAFADPSRRAAGRRLRRLDDFSPRPGELAERMRALELGLMKLSPMLRDDALDSLGPGREFVTFGWECREALVALGRMATRGVSAVRAADGLRLEQGATPLPVATAPAEWFFEADPAAVRADALGSFGLARVGGSHAYLTGAERIESPWLRAWPVHADLPADARRILGALRDAGLAAVELKSSGATVDIDAWRRTLRAAKGEPSALAFYPVGRSQRCAVLRLPQTPL